MRTRIKVTDLSPAQWAWLEINVPPRCHFEPSDVRMCVEFELTSQTDPVHVEMPPRAFVGLLERLATVERVANDPTTCDHGARVEDVRPSLFGKGQCLTFTDGCWTVNQETIDEALDHIDRTVRRPQAQAMVVPEVQSPVTYTDPSDGRRFQL